jgi:hypothetical protein
MGDLSANGSLEFELSSEGFPYAFDEVQIDYLSVSTSSRSFSLVFD